MHLKFWKTQSIGNDFVLVLEEDLKTVEDLSDLLLARIASYVSTRHFGIGSDGLLVLGRRGPNLLLRMFNPDGSEDFCGNGLRCAAEFAKRQDWVQGAFTISHRGQNVEVSLLPDGQICTAIGKADYTPEKVPVRSGRPLFKESVFSGMVDGQPLNLFGSALTTGSTHVVLPVPSLPDDHSFQSISSALEKADLYPEHTSVIWTKELAPDHLQIRIWERGAGETQGCGTGSAATAADYLRRKARGGRVLVQNPGGDVWVTAESWDGMLNLQSFAQVVYSGSISIDPLLNQLKN